MTIKPSQQGTAPKKNNMYLNCHFFFITDKRQNSQIPSTFKEDTMPITLIKENHQLFK